MPEELWSEAVLLAKEHGTCRIARAVGIDYEDGWNGVEPRQPGRTNLVAVSWNCP
jgi:hypothetical protein